MGKNENKHSFKNAIRHFFLNPYLLEYYIKNGFINLVEKGSMILRSDILFAFNLEDRKVLSEFYDSIFSFYLSKNWINYPYIPLNPDLIIRANGSIKIEWNNFPSKYIGINPTKNKFFEKVAFFYDEMLNDFNNYSFTKNYNSQKGFSLFGNLSSVRNQSNLTFASERCFAHYLILKSIVCHQSSDLFLGQVIRNK